MNAGVSRVQGVGGGLRRSAKRGKQCRRFQWFMFGVALGESVSGGPVEFCILGG